MEQPRRKRRLGDLLIQSGLISESQLETALQTQKTSGSRLGRVILDLGYISEEELTRALASQLGIPYIDLKEFPLDHELARKLPEASARRYRILPLQAREDGIVVGMVDPVDIVTLDTIAHMMHRPLHPAVVRETELLDLLDQLYRKGGELELIAGELESDLGQTDFDPTALSVEENLDAPVVRLIETLFEDAVRLRASDIHIEPDEAVLRVRLRVDGVLNEQIMKEKRIAAAVVMRLKIISGLDIAEKRLPQDGRFRVKVGSREIDVRISTMPTQWGESVVMRLLDQKAAVFNLDRIGMPEAMLRRFRLLLRRPHGMIVVTGPTGSGKTTTLYAGLSELNTPEKKIITVEDPVEFRLSRIQQVQVNAKIDLTFARVLRTALRQDPDVVLVGEIRDQETAEIALRAAMTGHLVLSTLHTNDALSSAMRLLDMGAEPFLVASALHAVLAQRLVRRICPHCREPQPPSRQELIWLENLGGMKLDASRFRHGRGCDKCNNSGYHGRVGVYELLEMSESLAGALRSGDPHLFTETARLQPGYKPLAAMALDYALEGITTAEEVLRLTSDLRDESPE